VGFPVIISYKVNYLSELKAGCEGWMLGLHVLLQGMLAFEALGAGLSEAVEFHKPTCSA